MKLIKTTVWTTAALLAFVLAAPATADHVILDDCIIDGSMCVGQDCVNGESFGFDTIRLKENNLRIKFQDTSSTASFPTNDWQITANDSSNGGANKFSIDDIDGGRTPFTLEASAPSHSLYVDDGGRLGFGTSTPVVELHVVDGDTPTLRLEQDGSSGFTPQTWDVAGNETNFFVRDATNGSKLPLRIRPSAPSNSIFVDTDGDVGMGTASPTAELAVVRADASDKDMLLLSNNGRSNILFQNLTSASDTWTMSHANNGVFAIDTGGGATELRVQASGNLLIEGTLTANASTTGDTFPDYVFEPGYELMSLGEVKAFIETEGHLPNVMSSADVEGGSRINMTRLQLQILEKVEELTLYTLNQQDTIETLEAANATLLERLATLEEQGQ